MKIKPYYLSCLVAGLLGAQACHDKLDVSQKSAITATSMWESEGDALAAVYGAYNKMRSTFSAAYVFWGGISFGFLGTRHRHQHNLQRSVNERAERYAYP